MGKIQAAEIDEAGIEIESIGYHVRDLRSHGNSKYNGLHNRNSWHGVAGNSCYTRNTCGSPKSSRGIRRTGSLPSTNRPRQTVDPKKLYPRSVENALRILLAVGGSTNAIIHLTAIAGRLGIPIPLQQLNKLSDETPVLIDLKPTGDHYMEDLFKAGGLGVVLRELKPLLNLDCLSVTGETLRKAPE